MTQTTTAKRARRMAREPKTDAQNISSKASAKKPGPSRLHQLEALLTRETGATIAEMVEATGWQPHSVRGAMAGALKKRGLAITSEKLDGVRRYRGSRAA
uniref:DUF3489 domain-containing protein n=1 Tax=Altererythrobacter segetis TaxID=1104773 RepID=UPI00140BDEA1|nr:DUF3489 domain-containing protein [Altererythrobacter segetis]